MKDKRSRTIMFKAKSFKSLAKKIPTNRPVNYIGPTIIKQRS